MLRLVSIKLAIEIVLRELLDVGPTLGDEETLDSIEVWLIELLETEENIGSSDGDLLAYFVLLLLLKLVSVRIVDSVALDSVDVVSFIDTEEMLERVDGPCIEVSEKSELSFIEV